MFFWCQSHSRCQGKRHATFQTEWPRQSAQPWGKPVKMSDLTATQSYTGEDWPGTVAKEQALLLIWSSGCWKWEEEAGWLSKGHMGGVRSLGPCFKLPVPCKGCPTLRSPGHKGTCELLDSWSCR